MTRSHRQSAFSLMEIIVVVVILAALIAIAVPGMNKVMQAGDVGRTRAMLNSLTGAADEYELQTGAVINHQDTSVTVGGDNDNTIGHFIKQASQIEACLNLMKAAAGKGGFNAPSEAADIQSENINNLAIVDAWGNKIRYAARVSHEDTFKADDYLPVHPRPFFASAGPDGRWGTVNMQGGVATPDADAQDNIYSFEAD